MSLTPDELRVLHGIASDVTETKDSVAKATQEIILLRRASDAHESRLDRHDFRIGILEQHVGVGALGGHRARLATSSTPPRSPEDLGLRPGDTGSTWLTKDVHAIVRRFEEQEAMRQGAEQALENERKHAEEQAKRTDRLLKRIAFAGSAALAVASTIAYLIGHLHL